MQLLTAGLPTLQRVWHYRLAALGLIALAAFLRLLYLAGDCPLDLAPDEAHYWDWSRRLDWSYYSKGPLVAYLIRLSCWLLGPFAEALTGNQMLAVRLPAVVCGSLLLTGLYLLTVQVFRREGLALAVVVVALTMPVIAAGSILMTIDAPYTCLWVWSLVLGHKAVFEGKGWAWPATGLLIALGILAKYTMVLWAPMLGLFLLATPEMRTKLRAPGFWIMVASAALGAVPILVWNASHGWVTVRHAEGHAGLDSRTVVHWLGPMRYLGMQFLLLLGFWFIVWVRALWSFRPGRETRPEIAYLWWMSAPMFVFFGVFSLKNGGGEPNWPVTAYLSGIVLAVAWLARELESRRVWYRRSTIALTAVFGVVGLGLTATIHDTRPLAGMLAWLSGPETAQRPLPMRRFDPTCRLKGWRTLAEEVDRLRAELQAEGVEPVLACSHWSLPGEVGFYCLGQPEVFSVGQALGDRHSQYDLWRPNPLADPQTFSGQTFILVGVAEEAARAAFAGLEPAQTVTHRENGRPIACWTIQVARGYRGFSQSPRGAF